MNPGTFPKRATRQREVDQSCIFRKFRNVSEVCHKFDKTGVVIAEYQKGNPGKRQFPIYRIQHTPAGKQNLSPARRCDRFFVYEQKYLVSPVKSVYKPPMIPEFMIDNPAGAIRTISKAGKVKRTIGKSILIGALCASSSAN